MTCEFETITQTGTGECGRKATKEFKAYDTAEFEPDPELFITYRCDDPDHAPKYFEESVTRVFDIPFRCVMMLPAEA